MDIHARIKQLCSQKKWSLSKLAKEAGLSETTVYDWFNENHYMPSLRAIEDICGAFEITLSEFYTDIEVDKLSDKELKLLETFKALSEKRQDALLIVAQTLKED